MNDKILMFKLNVGEHVRRNDGKGCEQYNITAPINGKYYGIILNSGSMSDISLEKIDNNANKKTEKIENVLLIYFETFNKTTNIVAIAENTTVYRKVQTEDDIKLRRLYKYIDNNNQERQEYIGYHTITDAKDMHILEEKYIPIDISKECRSFFRAQRSLSTEEKYKGLREQIINKTMLYLKSNEDDLQFEQIDNSTILDNKDTSIEPLYIYNTSTGQQINKKAYVSKKALINAKYMCEYNSEHKTFVTNKGNYYMEGHHLICCTVKISQEIWKKYNRNIDTEANIVSLCPTCHRQIHFGNKDEKSKIIETLYNKRYKDLKKIGIDITLEELEKIYNIS